MNMLFQIPTLNTLQCVLQSSKEPVEGDMGFIVLVCHKTWETVLSLVQTNLENP